MPNSLGSAYISLYPDLHGFESKIQQALSGIDVSSAANRIGSELGDGIGGGVDKASKSTGVFSGKMAALAGAVGGVASSIASGLVSSIASLSSEMVEASDSSQKFASTLSFAGIDTSTIDQLTESTQKYADETVYDLADIRNVTAQLASNGVDNYAQLAEAAGNLNAVAGGTSDTFKSVGLVMTQTAGAGKLTTENWNQLTDAIPGASGALQEAMRSAGAFEGNFREAMEDGEISADEFFAAVQRLGMQDVAVQAATSTSTIEGAMGNLQAAVVGVGSQVISALTPMLTGAMSRISEFVSGIPSALSGLGDAFATALSGGGTGDLTSIISGWVEGAMTTLSTAIGQAATQLPAMLQTVLPVVVAAVTSFITSFVTQLPALLTSFLGLVVSGISSFVSSIGSQLPTIIPQLLTAAVTAIGSLMTDIAANLPTYVGQILGAALDLFMGIVQAIPMIIPSVLSGIANVAMNAISQLPTFVGNMISAAGELFAGIVTAIPMAIPNIISGVQGILDDIADTISSFDLVEFGKNMIMGLANGISSAAGSVLSAIGDVVGGAVDWAKGLLGIASPSKVFAEIGGYTMEGLEIGISKAADGPLSAMESVVGGISSMRPIVDGSTCVPSAALANYELASSGGSYGQHVTQNFNTRVVRSDEDLYSVAPIIYRNATREARMVGAW